MKIFKNRGDIYIPKSEKKSREEMILKLLLVFIVIITIVFLVLLNHKYESVSQFFGEGEVTTTSISYNEAEFPAISGKTNYIIMETDDEKEIIHYIFIVQTDKDTKAYKVCALSPKMVIDKEDLTQIYKNGGGASLQTKLTEYLGIEIDCFADFTNSSFIEFSSKLGSIIYNSYEEIRFSGGKEDDKYTLRIKEGEQSIKGKDVSYLLRYYSDENNFSLDNEVFLSAITQFLNEKNFEDCESLFRLFIKSTTSNITVRDFENSKNALMYFCLKNSDITLYSVNCEYDKNILVQQSVKDIKGYFGK